MKKIIDYVLAKTFYSKKLSNLEHSLTLTAFFSMSSDEDKQREFNHNLKLLEQNFDKLPTALKLQRIPQINRYIDSTTTDEPILYSSYDATNTCYNIIIKTYLLNIFQKEQLNKELKDKLITYVTEHIHNKQLADLGTTLDFLKLDTLLEEKNSKQKTKKI